MSTGTAVGDLPVGPLGTEHGSLPWNLREVESVRYVSRIAEASCSGTANTPWRRSARNRAGLSRVVSTQKHRIPQHGIRHGMQLVHWRRPLGCDSDLIMVNGKPARFWRSVPNGNPISGPCRVVVCRSELCRFGRWDAQDYVARE